MHHLEQIEQELIATRCFEYVRIGYDRRKIELLPRCRIGGGRAWLEQTWHLLEHDGQPLLVIAGEEGITCTLRCHDDDTWRGRWLAHERMPVELSPALPQESTVASPDHFPEREPIDVVYTWVNGADPIWQQTRRRYQDQASPHLPGQLAGHLYRDNDELRFSLRSLAAFAPWVRQVYLITNGQVPSWLDTAQPGLTVVSHEAIFPDRRHLPTFNSHAIELHLHRIPNLSRHYLYMNDDVLLGRALMLSDFLDRNGIQRIYLESWLVPTNPWQVSVIDRAYAYTQFLLDARLGRAAKRSGRQAIAHTPQMYDRDLMAEVQQLWTGQVTQTSAHRFRSPDDVALRILYYYYALECEEHRAHHLTQTLYGHSSDYFFLRLRNRVPEAVELLDDLLFQRPKFICLNDEFDDSEEAEIIRQRLGDVLQEYYPQPSRFERQPAPEKSPESASGKVGS